jgi:3-dehydroquinate synthase
VVAADERESDLRRVLNLGHTIGHALEAATNYRHFLHGEAVAWGMHAAARISVEVGACDAALYERIRKATHSWGRLPSVTLPTGKVLRLLKSDKKAEAGVLHFVLPIRIGQVKIDNNVPESAISAAMVEIRRESRG